MPLTPAMDRHDNRHRRDFCCAMCGNAPGECAQQPRGQGAPSYCGVFRAAIIQCGAGPWTRGSSEDPAPLAQPYLVPTRDWGVVVDTASVPETNLADSRSQRIRTQPLAI